MPIKAKKRPTRTRTKKVSHRPPLKLSKIPPLAIDLRDPANAVITCEDCGTECPITGMKGGSVQKLVPHHTGQAHVQPGIRCRSSNRQIVFDLTLPEWWQARADAAREAANRRPSRVTRKPRTAPAPAVAQIATRKTRSEPDDGRPMWLVREMGWASTSAAVRDTDTRRAQLPAGETPTEGPQIPLEPVRITV
ncbi:hypothetical protein [Streptomyces spirodelae]|uniref:Uncharacterized protein n=1 Tax=Streptomyces spirodelae TaxID=2812904 RepID=A0ABS3X1F6_9ACTN|nr:hypothetical protein [Streptomyces spirodelae]MBO8189208.1 hypothetical protein [Streptomyces spirodelae]